MLRPLIFILALAVCGAGTARAAQPLSRSAGSPPTSASPQAPGASATAAQPPLDPAVVEAARDISANRELLREAYAQPPAFISDYRLNVLLCREMGLQPGAFVDFMLRVNGDPVLWCNPMLRYGGSKAEVRSWADQAQGAFSALKFTDEQEERMRLRCLKAATSIVNSLR